MLQERQVVVVHWCLCRVVFLKNSVKYQWGSTFFHPSRVISLTFSEKFQNIYILKYIRVTSVVETFFKKMGLGVQIFPIKREDCFQKRGYDLF